MGVRSLLVAHTDSLLADALAAAIADACLFERIFTAVFDPPARLAEAAKRDQPDLLLIPRMGESNWAPTLKLVREGCPDLRIIVVEVPDDAASIADTIRLGVVGIQLRGTLLVDLIDNLRAIVNGGSLCPPHVARQLFEMALAPSDPLPAPATAEPRLTPRELQVLELIDLSLSNKDIARRLGIELQTVKNHVHNILDKLQVPGRREAARLVRNGGVLPPRRAGRPGKY